MMMWSTSSNTEIFKVHTLTHRVGSTRAKLESSIIEDFPTKDTPKTGMLCLEIGSTRCEKDSSMHS